MGCQRTGMEAAGGNSAGKNQSSRGGGTDRRPYCDNSGVRHACVLRPDGGFCKLIGECYVHGIMDGEMARNLAAHSTNKLMEIRIR